MKFCNIEFNVLNKKNYLQELKMKQNVLQL